MTADVEQGVEFIGAGQDVGEFVGVCPESLLLGQELCRCCVRLEHLD
jgi:hypothetical protein